MASLPLTGRHVLDIQRAFVEAFPNADRMEELFLSIDHSFRQLQAPQSDFRANVLRAIQRAASERWLLQLVAKAHELVPNDPMFEALHSELAPLAPPQNVDYFEVCRLTGSHVMVDRAVLRVALKDMSSPTGKRILVVTGGVKSGKTHSVQLISYLHEMRGSFSLILIDLDAFRRLLGPGTIIEPADIAQSLVRKLGYDLSVSEPPGDAQWARWVLNFCDDFERAAIRDDDYRWVVVDAFNSVVVTQPTFDLIKELAYRVSQSLTRFRLVLLGFSELFPPAVLPHVAEERITPIGEHQLIEFFVKAYKQFEIPLDEGKLSEAIGRVLDNLDPSEENYLVNLGPRVSEELLKAPGPGGGR